MPPGGWPQARSNIPGANWGRSAAPPPGAMPPGAEQQVGSAPEVATSMQPTAMKPAPLARPRPAAKQAARPQPQVHAGDLICSQCATGNDPTRKFCRQCGASLLAAEVQAKLPWWKRFFGRKRKLRTGGAEMSTSAKSRGTGGKRSKAILKRIGAGLMAVVVLLFVVVPIAQSFGLKIHPPFTDAAHRRYSAAANRVKQFLHPTLDPIHPFKATATSADLLHAPDQAIDTYRNTYWLVGPRSPGQDAHGEGESITLSFDHKVTIRQIIITPGVQVNEGDFVKNPSPNIIRIRYNNGPVTEDVQVQDQPKPAAIKLKHGKGVGAITLTIVSVNPHVGPHPLVAISEIELFGDPGKGGTPLAPTSVPGGAPTPGTPPPGGGAVPISPTAPPKAP